MLEKEEIVSPNLEELKSHYHSIITLLGEDAGREGLLKTPERVAKAMLSLTKGYHMDPHEVLRSAKFQEEYSQMVIVKDIDFFSLCEHHMCPGSRYLFPSPASAGTHDAANQRLYPGDTEPIGSDGGSGGKAYVYADARRRKTKFYYYYFRLYRSFQSSQDSRRVYESDSARQGVIRFTKCGRCSSPSMRIASGTDEGVSRHR